MKNSVFRVDAWPCAFILCLVTEDLPHVDHDHHSALMATLGRKQSTSQGLSEVAMSHGSTPRC